MKHHLFCWSVLCALFLFSLSSCRGPIRNEGALTPIPTPVGIPPPTSPPPPPPPIPPTLTPVIIIHQVQASDTLYSLAVQYGTTVEAIQQANQMGDSTIVHVGQQLTIPQLTPAP